MCYTYDSLSRVTARTIRKVSDNSVISTETFTYDAAGNVTSAPDSSFQYDTNNRLISFKGNAVSYDLDGNMLSNGVKSFIYDSANRLVSAGGHTYTYNAEDVRIRNLCADEDTTYTYNTNAKLSMLLMKTTNGVVTKYVYGKGLIGEEVSGVFKTYHFDFRGSTIAITDASGNITDTFAYDTYGKLLSRTGTSAVIFGYNGRDGVVTDSNGLIYMRARYYSPDMKRFVNADIIPGKLSNAITLNRFAYANGNPITYVDPLGRMAFIPPFFSHHFNESLIYVPSEMGLIERAESVGKRATISDGTISIDMLTEEEEIEFLIEHLGMEKTCDIIASAACDQYNVEMGEEFLLSDSCVSNEIKEHIVAYEWSVGKRLFPNLLAGGYVAKNALDSLLDGNVISAVKSLNKERVYSATASIDMREKDVVANGGFASQAEIFDYEEGIRDIYVGTKRDPWANERK